MSNNATLIARPVTNALISKKGNAYPGMSRKLSTPIRPSGSGRQHGNV
jgi:hypothetical protein